MHDLSSSFVHRPNWDESLTSICMRCFGTAGLGKDAAALEKAEKRHVCHPAALRRREEMEEHYFGSKDNG